MPVLAWSRLAKRRAHIAISSRPCLDHRGRSIEHNTDGLVEFLVMSHEAILLSATSGVPRKNEYPPSAESLSVLDFIMSAGTPYV